jgi:opacity protein-like surface antigen
MVTGRLGVVDENMHAYFKGGFATADIGLQSNGPGGALITSSRDREYGWVGGLGFEYGWRPDIIFGVEYDFIHFSAGNNQLSSGVDIQTLMARVNYKFGPH